MAKCCDNYTEVWMITLQFKCSYDYTNVWMLLWLHWGLSVRSMITQGPNVAMITQMTKCCYDNTGGQMLLWLHRGSEGCNDGMED